MGLRELETSIVLSEDITDEVKAAATRTVRRMGGDQANELLEMLGLVEASPEPKRSWNVADPTRWRNCDHPRTEENTYTEPVSGKKRCATCKKNSSNSRPRTYNRRTSNTCVNGHVRQEGNYKLTKAGYKYCLVCLHDRYGDYCGSNLHLMDERNTYIRKGDGRRYCLACHKERTKKSKQMKEATS